jgi:hypothetical protein
VRAGDMPGQALKEPRESIASELKHLLRVALE